jgi:hypothetical protein
MASEAESTANREMTEPQVLVHGTIIQAIALDWHPGSVRHIAFLEARNTICTLNVGANGKGLRD